MIEKLPSYDKGQRKQAFCCSVLYIKDAAKGPVTANCKSDTVEYLKGLLQTVVNKREFLIIIKLIQYFFVQGCLIQGQVRFCD